MRGRWMWAAWLLLVASEAGAQMSLQESLQRRPQVFVPSHVSPVAAPVAPPATLSEAIAQINGEAAVVFTGEVLRVRATTQAVEVDFHVETALRGTSANSTYTLREWPGLWVAGDRRYRAGQRALVLLHAPSAAGYSSPVGGGDGVLPLHGDAITGEVDVRWLATRVQRFPSVAPKAAVRSMVLRPVARTPGSLTPAEMDAPPSKLDCALMVDMLRSLTAEQSTLERR